MGREGLDAKWRGALLTWWGAGCCESAVARARMQNEGGLLTW